MHSVPATGTGIAQEEHFGVAIFASEDQHEPQQEAVRSAHGSSESQTTHHDGRTIRTASRPTIDNALASLCTRAF